MIASKIQSLSKLSSVTPTKMLKKLPRCLATKKLQKLIIPVRIANMDASMLAGISFANKIFPDIKRMAFYKVSVTVLERKTKALGGMP